MAQDIRSDKFSFKNWILIASIVTGSFVFAFYQTWLSLVNVWMQSDDYSHAFLILPISLYLVWSKKNKLAQIPIVPSSYGLLLIFLSSSLFIFSNFAGITTLASFALVLSIIGIVLGLAGWRITKELVFPLFFLFLMIPIPSQVYYAATTPLQLFVTKVSVFVATLFDIPIYREGNVIHLPNRTLQVVAACSGMRSMISLGTLSLVFAYISLQSYSLRTVLVASAIPIAILINIIRVLAMVMAFHYYDYDLSVGSPHTYLGLFLFVIAIASIIMIQNLFSRLER
jgi:exosortase A